MNSKRSGHAIGYLNNYIFAIGGFVEGQDFSTKCEKFNIFSNEWKEIAPLNAPANNPCACSFRGKFIFKFGGKSDDNILTNNIEMYNPLIDKWSIIHIKFEQPIESFTILSSSACVQINPNHIFVFGGTFEDYSFKSKQSFLLYVPDDAVSDYIKAIQSTKLGPQNEYLIKGLNEKEMLFAEGFWNNTPIIMNNEVYSLQNITTEKNVNVVYLDRRRVMKFNSKEWFSYN